MEKPLAMAYIQNQTQPDVMDVSDGFSKGTIFKGLDKPFKPWGEK
ncbi:MAG: spore coat associated protein CotJA [Clostridia bacterium]|nr:spore coat associated protein CotJA [Clostridia bacterium]